MRYDTSLLAYTFDRIGEVLRYNDVTAFSEQLGDLYSAITGNQFLPCNITEIGKLRPELNKFVTLQLISLIELCSIVFVKEFKLDEPQYDDILTIGNDDYRFGNILTLNELQVVEMKLRHMIEVNRENRNLAYGDHENQIQASNEQYDITQILRFLIYQFKCVAILFKSDNSQCMGIRQQRNVDTCSVECLSRYAYLIGKAAVGYINTRSRWSIGCYTYDELREVCDIAKMKYTSMGAIHFSGALCCFNNIKLLPLTVVGKNRLGTRERDFIHDIITINHFLSTTETVQTGVVCH